MAPACVSCGFMAEKGIKFCPQCGSPVPETSYNREVSNTQKKKKKKKTNKPPRESSSSIDNPTMEESKPKIIVPPAATGDEASAIYKRMLAAVRGANRQNDEIVAAFKIDCKQYGQGELKAKIFHERLVTYFGSTLMLDHTLPQLVRLIPEEKKRKKLLKVHAKAGEKTSSSSNHYHSSKSTRPSSASTFTVAGGSNPPPRTRSSGNRRPYSTSDIRHSLDSNDSTGSASASTGGGSGITSRLTLMNRYADNPNCSICSEVFDLKRRRHRCRKCGAYVCNTCSPAKMLISPEQIVSDVKNYDPAHPQRVCTICAPVLQYFQDGLNTQYANCHKENPHEAKTRLHMPYSRSLEKECRNAADIIGNFFRPGFGADSDRYIPVSFLKKAQGLAFLTVIKAGLLITAKMGTGIVIAKLDDGTWSAPSAIGTAGIGGGLEGGGEIIEFMIIMGSKSAVKVFHRTQVNVGGGLSVAVGPYGREANAQAAASRGGFNANFSYSHSRGLFVGISLHGALIRCRSEMNSNFYGQKLTPEEILNGSVARPRAAQCLYDAIAEAMEGVARFDAMGAQVRQQKDDCNSCECKQFITKAFSKKCKNCGHLHDK